MSVTGAERSAEHASLHRESRLWELPRKAVRLGRSIGAFFCLISIGLTATWVVAVFFGIGLFILVPRPAKLTSGSGPESRISGAPESETPWLLESTDRLERLSTASAPVASQPAGEQTAVEGAQTGADPGVQNTTERSFRSTPPDPVPAHAADAEADQTPSPELGAAAATSEAGRDPSVAGGTQAAVVAPSPAPTPHLSPSRKRAAQKTTSGRPSTSHPPVQAIQDVLQKHSRLLK